MNFNGYLCSPPMRKVYVYVYQTLVCEMSVHIPLYIIINKNFHHYYHYHGYDPLVLDFANAIQKMCAEKRDGAAFRFDVHGKTVQCFVILSHSLLLADELCVQTENKGSQKRKSPTREHTKKKASE